MSRHKLARLTRSSNCSRLTLEARGVISISISFPSSSLRGFDVTTTARHGMETEKWRGNEERRERADMAVDLERGAEIAGFEGHRGFANGGTRKLRIGSSRMWRVVDRKEDALEDGDEKAQEFLLTTALDRCSGRVRFILSGQEKYGKVSENRLCPFRTGILVS